MNIEKLKEFDIEGLLQARALVSMALNNPKKKTPIDAETLQNWQNIITSIENEICSRSRELLAYTVALTNELL